MTITGAAVAALALKTSTSARVGASSMDRCANRFGWTKLAWLGDEGVRARTIDVWTTRGDAGWPSVGCGRSRGDGLGVTTGARGGVICCCGRHEKGTECTGVEFIDHRRRKDLAKVDSKICNKGCAGRMCSFLAAPIMTMAVEPKGVLVMHKYMVSQACFILPHVPMLGGRVCWEAHKGPTVSIRVDRSMGAEPRGSDPRGLIRRCRSEGANPWGLNRVGRSP